MTELTKSDPPAALRPASGLGFALLALAAVAVAAAALRYLVPGTPAAPPSVLSNVHAAPFLPLHAGFGALGLVLGPLQFLPRLRRSAPFIHRLIGSSYLLACLVAAVAGLMLAIGATAGPIAGAGFAALALGWIVTTGLGAVFALRGRFAAHRRWMIRSFALTSSAVTLRLQLGAGGVSGLDFDLIYLTAAWACWIPNLIAAELYILATGLATQNQPASRRAG